MKLTEGKRKAIEINQNSLSGSNRKNKKNPLDLLEEKLVIICSCLFGLALLVIIICAINRPVLDKELPENYNEFSHLYDNELYEMENIKAQVERENVVEDSPQLIAERRAITCWGDSYTIAPNDIIPSYAGILSQLSSRYVYNVGTPLDGLKVIAGRQGGVPLVTTPFIIPADKTPVEIAVDSSAGGRQYLDFTKNAGLNPVKIAGVSGVISKIDDKYYFTRDASGNQVMVLEPAEISTRAMDLRRDDICVFFVGSDSMVDEPENMVEIYKSMVEYLDGGNRAYIVVSPIVGDPAKLDVVDRILAQEFGENYLNLRKYFCNDLDETFVVGLTKEEKDEMLRGIIPERYFTDSGKDYLSQMGAEITGTVIYNKLAELGYFQD